MTTILYILIAILLLGILITVHEFGHFIFARICGIEVMEYAIGFGPKLLGWTSKKHGTKFSLRLLPLGGYCAFYGEDDAEGKHIDDPRAYAKQPVWKRMISVLMGPGMNFILAFVVLVLFFWIGGTAVYDPTIYSVEENGPAMTAGVQAGDVIVSVDGLNVMDGTLTTAMDAVSAHASEEPISLVVLREGEEKTLEITPFYDETLNRYRLGVTLQLAPRTTVDKNGNVTYVTGPCGLGEAISLSWSNCKYAGTMILNALKSMVTTGEGLDQTSGPVGVVSMVSEQVRVGGFDAFVNLLVVISINLGIMNLLPIPGLDGSRFLFMLLEAIRRKPIAPQKEAVVHLAGMAVLFAFMIFLTFRDVINLFG